MTADVEHAELPAKHVRQLLADDEQFRNAIPAAAVRQAARQPDLRLPQVLETWWRATPTVPHWDGAHAR
jgi:hypothetical protein